VFPLFFTYYDRNTFGQAVVSNEENLPIEKVKVEFFAKQYMDSPRLCLEIAKIAPGTSQEVPVYALFNDSIFGVTEGTKTAGEFILEYYYLGRKTVKTIPVTVEVENRNAMTWDDDRKAAAFITAKDPQVLGFAKGIASMVRSDTTTPAISSEFRTALAIYQGMKSYGIGYAIDPSTPFQKLSGTETAVDFLQFPGQTLSYQAGDCDDLSILYAALLESVGIESALITTPGHIFVAFNSNLSEENASRIFSDPRTVINRDGKTWVPVEITLVREGFLRSWSTGATEWHDSADQQTAGFYPVREAWKVYEPVGFAESGMMAALPTQAVFRDAYRLELDRFSRSQIDSRVAALQKQISQGKEGDKAANRLGILYAQFGLLAEARAQFENATKRTGLKEARINIGNIDFLENRLEDAKQEYQQVLQESTGKHRRPRRSRPRAAGPRRQRGVPDKHRDAAGKQSVGRCPILPLGRPRKPGP